jgi:hypothetical protein
MLGVVFLIPLAAAQDARRAEKSLPLQYIPAAVYKVDDPGHGETESWTFNLVALCKANVCSSKPLAATIELFSLNTLVDKREIGAAELEKTTLFSYRVLPTLPPPRPAIGSCSMKPSICA